MLEGCVVLLGYVVDPGVVDGCVVEPGKVPVGFVVLPVLPGCVVLPGTVVLGVVLDGEVDDGEVAGGDVCANAAAEPKIPNAIIFNLKRFMISLFLVSF